MSLSRRRSAASKAHSGALLPSRSAARFFVAQGSVRQEHLLCRACGLLAESVSVCPGGIVTAGGNEPRRVSAARAFPARRADSRGRAVTYGPKSDQPARVFERLDDDANDSTT